jgi:hypothetical protein
MNVWSGLQIPTSIEIATSIEQIKASGADKKNKKSYSAYEDSKEMLGGVCNSARNSSCLHAKSTR